MTRREVGDRGEKLAVEYLEKHGYKILETNFRCREGEIDIISNKGENLVFVEVRAKKSRKFGTPEESVTLAKRERLKSLADIYLQRLENLPSSWRIDLVVIELTSDNRIARLEHIENAIE